MVSTFIVNNLLFTVIYKCLYITLSENFTTWRYHLLKNDTFSFSQHLTNPICRWKWQLLVMVKIGFSYRLLSLDLIANYFPSISRKFYFALILEFVSWEWHISISKLSFCFSYDPLHVVFTWNLYGHLNFLQNIVIHRQEKIYMPCKDVICGVTLWIYCSANNHSWFLKEIILLDFFI